jgi:KDO2-lipid IV(A) lauroyltransferase
MAALVRLLLRSLAVLPLRVLHEIGAMLGWVAYVASPRYRHRLRENLAIARLDDSATRRQAIGEAGKSVVELAAIWFGPLQRTLGFVRDVRGAEYLEQARSAGRGVIFLTPHLGSFELLACWYGAVHPLTVLYRPPKQRWLEPVMAAGRSHGHVKLAPTNLSGVRRLIRALRAREAIGLLPDQVPTFGEGAWVEFFGRPAYTMTLTERLRGATDAAVLMIYGERLRRGGGFRIHFVPMPERLAGEDALRHMNRAIEQVVRQCPAQYLWAYNRYKRPPRAREPQSLDGAASNADVQR